MSGGLKVVLVLVVAGILGALVLFMSDDGAGSGGAELSGVGSAHEQDAPRMGLLAEGRDAPDVRPLEVAASPASPVEPGAAEQVASQSEVPAGPQVKLVGRLVDAAGRPVEQARVVVHLPGDGAIGMRLGGAQDERSRPEGRSAKDGRFSVSFALPAPTRSENGFERRLAASVTHLVAVHEAFSVLAHEVATLREGEIDLGTLVLAAGAGVRGRVVDEGGRPVVGAEIEAASTGASSPTGVGDPLLAMLGGDLAETYTRAVSGVDGRFVVRGVAPGPASVTARADGRRMGFVDDLELTAASVVDVGDIALPRGGAIAGFVLDQGGSPVAGATVRVMSMQRIVLNDLESAPRQQLGQEWRLAETTDERGWFELSGLGSGQYTVRVRAEGFAPSSTENVAVGTNDFSVRLQPLGELEVLLVDGRTNAPIDGARIVARPRADGAFMVVTENGGAVDAPPADGSRPGLYLVHDVGPTGVDLDVVAEGYASRTVEVPNVTVGGRDHIDVALVKESVLAGLVLDADGQGVAGARVSLAEHEEPEFTPGEMRIERRISIGGDDDEVFPWKRAVADETGRFVLRGVPAGSWDLRAAADGFVTSEAMVLHLDAGDEQRDLRLSLAAAGSLAGLVVEDDGTPVRGADVVVKSTAPTAGRGGLEDHLGGFAMMMGGDLGPDGPRRATTDAQGRFEVRDLAPGRYLAELSSNGAMSFGGGGGGFMVLEGAGAPVDDPRSKAEVVVTAGEQAFARLVRPPTSVLEGQVVAGGQGVPDVTLRLKQAGSFMPFGGKTATSDRYGNFVFEGVEPGRYELSGIIPKAALPETLEVELVAGRTETARLVFEGSTISGQVLDDESGAGVGDMLVEVKPVQSSSGGAQPRTEMTMMFVTADSGGGGGSFTIDAGGTTSRVTTDREGNFEVRYLKPGEYELVVSGGRYAEASSGAISVDDGQDLDGLELKVGRGAVLVGTVVAGDTGKTLDGVPVSLRPAGGGRGDSQMTMTENGAYRFEGLAPGDYDVSVLGSGFGGGPLANETVTLGKGEERTLDLRTEG